ncbi:hypothetical protein RDV89_10445 [Nocardioides zeae]|uniref:Uncharacterized protein n=1 Tax=Nocardioides imazamoxiresistens TaxID=3231893 RepID=A0ABU3PW74_9ACTN|nr:hypothetical protein [Nocardioides zeae]MDT9593486.1 hypothetical protein [Nocardioides zeae]
MHGNRRRRLRLACLALALVPLAAVALPLVVGGPTQGSSSPEVLVDDLAVAVNERDVAGLAALLDRESARDLDNAASSLSASLEQLFWRSDVEFAVETARLVASLPDADTDETLAVLNATDLRLRFADGDTDVVEEGGRAEIRILGGEAAVDIDAGRISEERRSALRGASGASTDLDLGDVRLGDLTGRQVVLTLVALERDGRWYLSLPQTAELLAQELSS